MTFAVISKCTITFPKETPKVIFDKILKMVNDDIEYYQVVDDFSEINSTINFETSGSNGIDYDHIKEMKEEALELLEKQHTKEGFTIACNEFTEACDGYYFEYDEKNVCSNCNGKGSYMGDVFVGGIKTGYDQIDCEECNGTGVKE